jgi:hypothetical protein
MHITLEADRRSGTTPKSWLAAGAQCTTWINRATHAEGIGVIIGANAAEESQTAQYDPAKREIELRTSVLLPGMKPAHFDLGDRLWDLRHAPFIGAMAHEASHAAWSRDTPASLYAARWDVTDPETGEVTQGRFTRREMDVIVALEESRIEYKLLSLRPDLIPFLRRMATEIVNKDFKLAKTRYGASIGAALTVARVDAGSVSKAAGKRFGKALREILDVETLSTLRQLWREYHVLDMDMWEGHRFPTMKWIAERWIEVTREDDADGDDLSDLASMIAAAIAAAMGGDGEGEGEGEGEASAPGDPDSGLGDRLDEIAREEAVEADTEIVIMIAGERHDRDMKDRAENERRRRAGKATASRVFRRGEHGRGEDDGRDEGGTNRSRPPEADERAAATALARELAKITTHDKIITRTNSALPPGRLRGRAATLESAQLANRQLTTAEPFTMARRRHVESDKIKIAVLTDVSGSMGFAMEPLAVTNYVLANAAHKVDAEFCAATFGSLAKGLVKSGQKVPDVRTIRACAGTENIAPALQAVDAELDLLDGTGTRVLFILTDAELVEPRQRDYTRTFMRLCKARGVTVVWCHWMDFTSNYGYGTVIDLTGKSAAQCATIIGQQVIQAVRETQKTQGAA